MEMKIKPLTKKEIVKANKDNPVAWEVCPHCHCNVIDELVEKSKKYVTDAWISGCPVCNYSFCD